MDNRNDKEKWLNEVMGSLDGMRKAEANPFLHEKIIYKMEQKGAGETVPVRAWYPKWVIAGLLILVINGITIIKETHKVSRIENNTTNAGFFMELGPQTTYNY